MQFEIKDSILTLKYADQYSITVQDNELIVQPLPYAVDKVGQTQKAEKKN